MSYFYDAMNEVLSRPHYDILTGRAVDHQQMIMEAIGRAVVGLIEQLQLNIPEYTEYNTDTLILIFAAVSALLLFGIAAWAVFIILRRRRKKTENTAHVSAIFDEIENKRYSLHDLIKASKQLAEKSQYRDAVRLKYIAVLVSLNEKRTIKVNKSKTNAQLARELGIAAPDLYNHFVAVADSFHKAWFGFKKIDEDKYTRFSFNAEGILNAEKK